MRLVAQISMVVAGLLILMIPRVPLLLVTWWIIFPFVAFFPLWYVIFDRHREANNDAVVAELQTIRNAISDLAQKSGALPLVRQ